MADLLAAAFSGVKLPSASHLFVHAAVQEQCWFECTFFPNSSLRNVATRVLLMCQTIYVISLPPSFINGSA